MSDTSYKKFMWIVAGVVIAGLVVIASPQIKKWLGGKGKSTDSKAELGTDVVPPSSETPPPVATQPARIRQTYEAGKTYSRTVDCNVHARGEHKD